MDNQDLNQRENSNEGESRYQDYTAEKRYDDNYYEKNDPGKSNSIIALITGILSLVFCCCSIIGLIPGILAIVFFARAKKNGEESGMAIAGLVCAIIGIIFSILSTMFWLSYGPVIYMISSNQELAQRFQTMDTEERNRLIMQMMNK
ncbi:MAG: DUF4190 domain-containing protein [Lachnospiraceae bacterium]|nr:DUF4190 domain-containing protein [Lachnospiraceae bacterium]